MRRANLVRRFASCTEAKQVAKPSQTVICSGRTKTSSRLRHLHGTVSLAGKDIPCVPEGTFPGATSAHLYSVNWHRELGGIFCERVAGARLVFIACPDLCHQVFANEGRYL